jgi:hypothetical protein
MIDVYIACFCIIIVAVALWLRNSIKTYPASILVGLALYIAIRMTSKH